MSTDNRNGGHLNGLPFAKMTGSGNDFVFFDGRQVDISRVISPEAIQAICNRHNGIGADGIVILEALKPPELGMSALTSQARILYFNSDGTPADLCGNATLCSTVMAVELGLATVSGMGLDTPSGRIASRVVDGLPEIELQPVTSVQADMAIGIGDGELRIGFAVAGIPHVVVLCEDADAIDLETRGPTLRHHPATGAKGANVNWVSRRSDDTWRYRTFERGVEGETQACGTGAVAAAILLTTWELAKSPIRIRSSSGRDLEVRLERSADAWRPTLRGEGRVIYRGTIGDLPIGK
ncbi:MAG: diaminopimelate epimerase [Gemmatimonadaceae bacterium]|nr:diaminopimelate epimerase [Gemmatimonadaceae bacterium]